MRLTRNKKNLSVVAWSFSPKRLLCGIHDFTISIYDLCRSFMRVQTGKVPHAHKGISLLIAFEYKQLLLLKSPQNKAPSTIAITKNNKAKQVRHIIIYQWHFEIKLFILQMSRKKTSLDDGDNAD